MTPYAQRLTPLIRQILDSSDLATISAKGVRKQLVAKGHDEAEIKANRGDIDKIISEIYDELTALPSDAPPSPPSSPDRPLAPPPPSSLPRPLHATVKREREREHKPKREELERSPSAEVGDDEAYARRLQSQFDADSSRASRGGASSSRAKSKAKPKKNPVKRKKSSAVVDGSEGEGGDGEVKKRRANPNNAFNKELILSDSLSALVGEARLSRPQTVKRIWDYVKARNLQDQSDKRFIICDDKLHSVFHTDKIHMFTMNKLLARHFMDPDEVVPKKDEP